MNMKTFGRSTISIIVVISVFVGFVFSSFSVSLKSTNDFSISPRIPLQMSFCHISTYDKLVYSWHEDDNEVVKTEIMSFDGFTVDSFFDDSFVSRDYQTTQTTCDPENDRLVRFSIIERDFLDPLMQIRKLKYDTVDFDLVIDDAVFEKEVSDTIFETCRVYDSFYIGNFVFFLGHGEGPSYDSGCGTDVKSIIFHFEQAFGKDFSLGGAKEDEFLMKRIVKRGFSILGFFTDGSISEFTFDYGDPGDYTKNFFHDFNLAEDEDREIEMYTTDDDIMYIAYHSVNPTLIYRLNLNDVGDADLLYSFDEAKVILGMSLSGEDEELLYVYEPRKITKIRVDEETAYLTDYELTFPSAPSEDDWADFFIFESDVSVSTNPLNEATYSVDITTLTSMYQMQSSDSDLYFYELSYSSCDGPGRYYSSMDDEVGACFDCDPGYVSESDVETCEYCESGNYRDHASLSCKQCSRGTYSDTAISDAADCQLCPKGTYSPILGASDISYCKPCPVGTYGSEEGLASSENCTQCPSEYRCAFGSSSPVPLAEYSTEEVHYTSTDEEVEEEESSSGLYEPLIVKSSMLVAILVVGILLACCLLLLYVPFPQVVCKYLCCCLSLRTYDFFYNMSHDVEDGDPPFKKKTGIGGCLSILAVFLMVTFLGWSIYDFFFNNTTIVRSTQLYFGSEESGDSGTTTNSDLEGDYYASIIIWGDFDNCDNYNFSHSGFVSSVDGGRASIEESCEKESDRYAKSCACTFECVECTLSKRVVNLEWDMGTQNQYISNIQYSLTLPHYDEEKNEQFTLSSSSFISQSSSSSQSTNTMSEIDVDVSLFRSMFRKIHGADFITRIFDIPLVDERIGVMGSVQNVEKTAVELSEADSTVSVRLIGTLSNFRYVIEESNSQTFLSLIGQSFALCGLSVSIFGVLFGCAEGFLCCPCLTVNRNYNKLLKLLSKRMLKKLSRKGRKFGKQKQMKKIIQLTAKVLGKPQFRMKSDVAGLKSDMEELKGKISKMMEILNIPEEDVMVDGGGSDEEGDREFRMENEDEELMEQEMMDEKFGDDGSEKEEDEKESMEEEEINEEGSSDDEFQTTTDEEEEEERSSTSSSSNYSDD